MKRPIFIGTALLLIMSIQKSISITTIALLVVGLVIGGGGGYIYSSSVLQPKIGGLEIQVTALNSDIVNLTNTVTNLRLEKTSMETLINNLEAQISSLEDIVTSVEDENTRLDVQVAEFEVEISNYGKEIDSLLNLNADLESQMSNLHNESMFLNDTINELEKELSQLKSDKDYLLSVLEYYLPDPFKIGITAYSTQSFFGVQAVANISKVHINSYCDENDYPFRFDFTVYKNFGDPYKAVDNTIRFNEEGVNLIIGHETDAECELSLNYVNSHDMIMLSPSATSRTLAVSADNFYRICPIDLAQGPVMAEMLNSWGIEAVIVMLRNDAWANGLFDVFEDEFNERGGIIHKIIRYEPDASTFIPNLNSAETAAQEAVATYSKDKTAVLLMSKNEAAKIIEPAVEHFPTLSSLFWFGTESTSKSAEVFSRIASEANKLKLFGPVLAQEENAIYAEFRDEYQTITGDTPDFYKSALYDACWLYALSVINAYTVDTSFVKPALEEVAEEYHGASGWCGFNENGDRKNVDYEIWGYAIEDDQLMEVKYGYYESMVGSLTWFTEKGINPPG